MEPGRRYTAKINKGALGEVKWDHKRHTVNENRGLLLLNVNRKLTTGGSWDQVGQWDDRELLSGLKSRNTKIMHVSEVSKNIPLAIMTSCIRGRKTICCH